MTSRPAPTLLIGLGAPGALAACKAASGLVAGTAAFDALLRVVVLEHDGFYHVPPERWAGHEPVVRQPCSATTDVAPASETARMGSDVTRESPANVDACGTETVRTEARHPEQDDADPVTRGGAPPPEPDIRWALLCGEAPDVWKENAARLRDCERTLVDALAAHICQLRDVARLSAYERSLGTVGQEVNVVVYAGLHDPIGSAALLPLHAELHGVFCHVLPDIHRFVQLVLLCPDLYPGTSLHGQARAYAALCELDWTLDARMEGNDPLWIDRVWLLSGRNGEDLFVNDAAWLSGLLTGHAGATVRGLVSLAHAPVAGHLRRVRGRSARFGSFGFAQLVFPREALVGAAVERAIAVCLRALPALEPVRLHRDMASAEVQRFILNQPLSRLDVELRHTSERRLIFKPFLPPPRQTDPCDITFTATLRQALAEYDRSVAPEWIANVTQRSLQVRNEVEAALFRVIAQQLDGDERGALARAEAFASMLGGVDSEHLVGDSSESVPTVRLAVEGLFFGYFEPKFEAVMFKPSESGGSRRERKLRLHEDISALGRQIAQTEYELQVRTSAAADDDNSPFEAEEPGARSAQEIDAEAIRREKRRQEEVDTSILRETLERDRLKLDDLKAAHEKVVRELRQIEEAIRDPNQRRHLFELERARHNAELETALTGQDAAAKTASDAYEHAQAAGTRAGRWAAGLGTAAVLVALATMPWAGFYPAIPVLGMSGYHWWRRVGAGWRQARAALRYEVGKRDGVRDGLEASGRCFAEHRFEHFLYSQIADWGSATVSYVRTDVIDRLQQLRADLNERGDSAESEAASIARVEPESGTDYLLPPGGLAEVWRAFDPELQAATSAVLTHWPPRTIAESFGAIRAGGSELEEELRAAARKAVEPLAAANLDEYLDLLHPAPRALARRMETFRRLAAPMVQTVFDVPDPSPWRLELLQVDSTSPGQRVHRGLRALGTDPVVVAHSAPTRASLLRMVSGLTCFQCAAMHPMRRAYLALDDDSQRAALRTLLIEEDVIPADIVPA